MPALLFFQIDYQGQPGSSKKGTDLFYLGNKSVPFLVTISNGWSKALNAGAALETTELTSLRIVYSKISVGFRHDTRRYRADSEFSAASTWGD